MKVRFVITLDLLYPIEEIGKQRLKDHVAEWAEIGGKCLHPDDPLFDGVYKATCGKLEIVE